MQILRYFNINNFFTDITMKSKIEMQTYCGQYIHFGKDYYQCSEKICLTYLHIKKEKDN